MNSGGIRTKLKAGLRRFRNIGLRTWLLLDSLLGARIWRGLSTLFLVGLTVAIFIFGQQLEDYRHEQARQETIAHLSAYAGIGRQQETPGNETTPCGASILVQNSGPETAYRTKIELTLGSDGIHPAGSPDIERSDGNTTVKVEQCEYLENAGATKCIITVERLYPREYVQLTLPFAVDEQTSQQLRSVLPDDPNDWLSVPLSAEALEDGVWALSVEETGEDVEGRILALFMPEIRVSGQKIAFQY